MLNIFSMEEIVITKSKKAIAAKIIAIIAFSLVFATLGFAITSDIVLFAQQIISFIAACIASVFLFFIGIILMVLSLVLVFGFYLLDSKGFWPATWATNGFKDIVADAAITSEQLAIITSVRIILIAICFIVLVGAIVALALRKASIKDGYIDKQKLTKAFGVVTIIFASLGLLVGSFTLAILSLI